jgi:hypothetical protein
MRVVNTWKVTEALSKEICLELVHGPTGIKFGIKHPFVANGLAIEGKACHAEARFLCRGGK